MISHQDRCLFVHIPKAAGQSVESVFVERMGLTWQQREALLLKANNSAEQGPPRLAHLTAQEYLNYGYVTPEQFQQYFKFSFVRNPWARIVSEYNYRRMHGDAAYQVSFKHFLFEQFPTEDMDDYHLAKDYYRHVIPQWQFLYDDNGKPLVDFIGKFERLQKDFTIVCQHLDITAVNLPHKNKTAAEGLKHRFIQKIKCHFTANSNNKHYSTYYDNESQGFIADLYKKDIELFNYQFIYE